MIPLLAHSIPHSPAEWLLLLGGLLVGVVLVLVASKWTDDGVRDTDPDEAGPQDR